MTPIESLRFQAETCPKHIAFISRFNIWTYERLMADAERMARALAARGVRQGDRVALHMGNIPEMAIAYYGCFRIGAIACPLGTRLKTAELRPMLRRLRPALYIGQAEFHPQIAGIEPEILASNSQFTVDDLPEVALSWATLLHDAPYKAVLRDPDIHSPAVLLTTSGTTGQPKFVTHTPATLSAIADAWAHLGFRRDLIAMHCVPMVHSSGLYTMLGCVRHGVPLVLLERFDPEAVLDAVEIHRCSCMLGLPFMYAALLESQRKRPRRVNSLRLCLTAGDVCPGRVQQDFPYSFGVPLHSFWASTETIGLTFSSRFGPVSRVAPGTEVRIADDKGKPVPRGEVGELLIRSPCVSVGYWEGPDQIKDATVAGWFRTGDFMRQGDGDELWFVSRKKDLIVRGGSNIAPVEIETVLKAHPAVRDAAVFGARTKFSANA